MKKTNIVITVCLDQNKIPEKMSWTAKDGGIENQKTKGKKNAKNTKKRKQRSKAKCKN